MYKNWITTGFRLDKSTLAPQLSGGSVITDQHFLTLIELLSDEKQHRYQLEQKVAELEKRQGSVNQDSKMYQMENYIKQLESRISFVEQITASPVNNTCTCLADREAIEKLIKRTMDIELKYSVLETKYNDFYHAKNKTDQRLNELQQEVGDLRNLKTINQLQTLNSLKIEVQTLNLKTSQLESSSQARGQEFLALYRNTQTTANYVTNNSLFISQIQNNMNVSQFIANERLNTTGNSLKILEYRQKETDKYLRQLEHRHNVTYGELYSNIRLASEKVMVTACTSKTTNYTFREVIKYNVIRASTNVITANILSSGMFTCEKSGLYIVMVSMRATSSKSYYWIMKNNTQMLFIQNMQSTDGTERSVSGSLAVDLDIGDTIYVIPNSVFGVTIINESCLSVVKYINCS
ncbi:unnamed protein product [Mytilus edulis]|uniref:C1q domain-containing protein n=1 Tax=Mytilus edulis TaxID=6550 RepID=A0A8S3SAT6_MYTED|nr:unnamed protein product [Mytilus edulis]